jgi:hypothetical protein
MDVLEFILIIAVFAGVLYWYLQNAEAGSDGLKGFLALTDDPEEATGVKKRSYRFKERAARGGAAMRDVRAEQKLKPTYRSRDGDEADRAERMRRKFRRQDEARYRVKDKAANYKKKKDPADEG